VVAPLEALTDEVVLLVTYIKIFSSMYCEQNILKIIFASSLRELFQRV
jgi:hypothetical protein